MNSFVSVKKYNFVGLSRRYSATNNLASELSGICVVYKPPGPTSAKIVEKIKHIINPRINLSKKSKIKVGHGGTLDPIAEGVLVIGIGKGTKLLQSYLNGSKEYIAVAKLGESTDTYDSMGVIQKTGDFKDISLSAINKAIMNYKGEILQMPPMFSALKKDGKKLYEYARKGIEIEREKRKITIYKIEVLENDDPKFTASLPFINILVECSAGCYIRSLINDLGNDLNCGAHMTKLIRSKQGQFTLDDCLKDEEINYESILQNLIRCNRKIGLSKS